MFLLFVLSASAPVLDFPLFLFSKAHLKEVFLIPLPPPLKVAQTLTFLPNFKQNSQKPETEKEKIVFADPLVCKQQVDGA